MWNLHEIAYWYTTPHHQTPILLNLGLDCSDGIQQERNNLGWYLGNCAAYRRQGNTQEKLMINHIYNQHRNHLAKIDRRDMLRRGRQAGKE